MTKNEREFIVSTIAGKPRDVSGEAFMELNRLLYETSVDKTCENCVFLHKPDLTENIYRCWEGVSTIEEVEIELNFGCNKFNKREQDAD